MESRWNVRKSKNVIAEVWKDGKRIGYLTETQEEKGYDIELDLEGYEIKALEE